MLARNKEATAFRYGIVVFDETAIAERGGLKESLCWSHRMVKVCVKETRGTGVPTVSSTNFRDQRLH
jgi:hypothetical protein